MPNVKIEAVTPVHNRRDITLECLRSLLAVDLSGIDLSITIVDDGSTDGTSEAVAAEFPEVNLIRGDGNLWYTGGMNAGMKAALEREPDYILGFNNDSTFDKNFLTSMIGVATSVPRSVVGAVLINWEDKHSIFQVSPEWNFWRGGVRHWHHQALDTIPNEPWEVPIIVGNCLLIPADAVREAGFMNEKLLPQFGDAGFTPSMRRLGWRLLIDPNAHVYCKPNDIPVRFGSLSAKDKFKALFTDKFSPHSLRRRFYTNMFTAPNKVLGFGATIVFYLRYLMGRNLEGSWGDAQIERPLSETFAENVVSRSKGR